MMFEGETDEVDAVAAGETPITPAQAGTQSATARRRRPGRTVFQKARAPLSTKPQDMQVRFAMHMRTTLYVICTCYRCRCDHSVHLFICSLVCVQDNSKIVD